MMKISSKPCGFIVPRHSDKKRVRIRNKVDKKSITFIWLGGSCGKPVLRHFPRTNAEKCLVLLNWNFNYLICLYIGWTLCRPVIIGILIF